MIISSYGQTDRGLVREANEDAFWVDDQNRLYAVADGLGGLPRGAEASDLAIQLLRELVASAPDERSKNDFGRIFQTINQRVYLQGRSEGGELGMGTTLTTVRITDTRMVVGHVGDTAIVRFRGSVPDKITSDHTMEQEIRDRLKPGEDAFIPDYFAHTLTRCIGQADDLSTDVLCLEIEAGDRFLICSDGITKVFDLPELGRIVAASETPKACVSSLIRIGNNRGGPDNLTAIAIFAG